MTNLDPQNGSIYDLHKALLLLVLLATATWNLQSVADDEAYPRGLNVLISGPKTMKTSHTNKAEVIRFNHARLTYFMAFMVGTNDFSMMTPSDRLAPTRTAENLQEYPGKPSPASTA